jgi:hypothetical protein
MATLINDSNDHSADRWGDIAIFFVLILAVTVFAWIVNRDRTGDSAHQEIIKLNK